MNPSLAYKVEAQSHRGGSVVAKRLRISASATLGAVLLASVLAFAALDAHLGLEASALILAVGIICASFFLSCEDSNTTPIKNLVRLIR